MDSTTPEQAPVKSSLCLFPHPSDQTALRSLLDNLLELQWLLLEKNKETVSVLHDQGEARKDEGESPHDSDEEIPSDKEEGGGGDDIMGCIISNKDDSDQLDEGDDRQEAVKTRRSRKRKRGSSGWVGEVKVLLLPVFSDQCLQ